MRDGPDAAIALASARAGRLLTATRLDSVSQSTGNTARAIIEAMSNSILERIPVVAGLGFIERIRRLPGAFTATLQVEPENRYFRHAIAVMAGGEKVGYIAPEIAHGYYELVRAADVPLSCPGRAARHSDHATSGVELVLDFSGLPVPERVGWRREVSARGVDRPTSEC